MTEHLFEDNDWDVATIQRIWDAIKDLNDRKYKFDIYDLQMEIISADQMVEILTSIGMPQMYNHWSFGKRFLQTEKQYRKGTGGMTYELVINSDPCICYLQETNTATMQTLVLSHAGIGHNHVFKSNYLFKEWTDATGIVDYLHFARNYIEECEKRYGVEAVEQTLDACHAIQDYGIDKYKRPKPLNAELQRRRVATWADYRASKYNELFDTIPEDIRRPLSESPSDTETLEENLLYFIEKKSPILQPWEREIVRIVRKINQYFYPQAQTKMLNEGLASFVHFHFMHDLCFEGKIPEGSVFEFLRSHSGVVMQPCCGEPHYSGINPYALGFHMFQDIKRICEEPDAEDKALFPDIAGNNKALDVIKEVVANYRDESMILQFLSPKIVRKFEMFNINIDSETDYYLIKNVQSDEDFKDLRKHLAAQYERTNWLPQIEVKHVDWNGDRTLTLTHDEINGKLLDSQAANDVLEQIEHLWGFPVYMEGD